MSKIFGLILIIDLLLQGCSVQKLQQMRQARTTSAYQQIDLQSLIRRFPKVISFLLRLSSSAVRIVHGKFRYVPAALHGSLLPPEHHH